MARKIVSPNALTKQIAKRHALRLYTRKTFWTRKDATTDALYCIGYEDGSGKRWAATVTREAWGTIPTQRRGWVVTLYTYNVAAKPGYVEDDPLALRNV